MERTLPAIRGTASSERWCTSKAWGQSSVTISRSDSLLTSEQQDDTSESMDEDALWKPTRDGGGHMGLGDNFGDARDRVSLPRVQGVLQVGHRPSEAEPCSH